MVKGIQAHFNDETPDFKSRIENTIPIGVEGFATENQWESMDKYVTTTTEVDAVSGKTRIVLPTLATGGTDFFKPVHIWTDNNSKVDYIDRARWASRQRGSQSARDPLAYTQIGPDLFLDTPSTGITIYMIYTRTHEDIDLPDLPFHYHGAVMMYVIWYLTPGMLTTPEGLRISNPAKSEAWASYQERIGLAVGHEHSVRDRVRRFLPDPVAQGRNNYR